MSDTIAAGCRKVAGCRVRHVLMLSVILTALLILFSAVTTAATTSDDVDQLIGATDTLKANIILDQFSDPATTPEDIEALKSQAGKLGEDQQGVVDSEQSAAGIDPDDTGHQAVKSLSKVTCYR